ncbi:tRNA lysidine(34) synthetase TilS [Rheinheimera metallidurans]|uniref:tRNA lysidine(34) synthetase TilS n=1 Tax=Rheinheimera metallidurans TaxID=2925781 RepID=UPI0030028148
MSELSPSYLLSRLQLQRDSHVVLALSGGLDSVVLLDLLVKARNLQPFALQAVYVHHGISNYASQWGEFCAQQCTARDVAFTQCRVQLQGSDNLEQKARDARYQALSDFVCSEQHTLLTAHHGDDQIETLFLALKRGAGAAGLRGIASRRNFAKGSLLRPLLGFSRTELEQYANQQQLTWVEDDSNSDTRFDRNFIRQHITPALRQRWPHFTSSAARSMQHVAQLQQLADHYTELALAQCVNANTLSLSELAKQIPAQQDLVIRRWLAGYNLNPDSQWLTTLKQQVIAARIDASPELQLADYQLRRFADRLYLLTPAELAVPLQGLNWQGEAELKLPAYCGSLVFSLQQQGAAIPLNITNASVVFGQLSLRFKPFGASVSKPLKQWFKLWQVPPWQRLRVPLIVVDNQLVAVVGYASSVSPLLATQWLSWQA